MGSADPQQFTDTDTYTRETTDVENISENPPHLIRFFTLHIMAV